jgi:glycine/D-amino acid oxidase-like deaminating enzyme
VVEVRRCARPQSVDGRPFIGRLPWATGLLVCAGHGPWGISTGPGSAALAVEALLSGDDAPISAALRATRAIP